MDRDIFIQTVLPLRPQLAACARRMMDNAEEAEDITQEVLLKLWNMKSELPQYRSVAALSMRMTKNLCINALKTRQRWHTDVKDSDVAADVDQPDRILEEKDEEQHLSLIIAQLPGLQRSILQMKHLEGMENDEIAACTGTTPEAVRMNLSRARRRVKELFSKYNDDNRR